METLRRWCAVLLVAGVAGCASGSGGPTARPGEDGFLRTELFVQDLDRSVGFYTRVLGFHVEKESPGYVAVRRGSVVLGLGPVAKLSSGQFFRPEITQQRNGLGVELVIEVEDVAALQARVQREGYPILATLARQPWGLLDFRLADPDGYYLRLTSSK